MFWEFKLPEIMHSEKFSFTGKAAINRVSYLEKT
jgi:hypothetical protein